MLCIFKGVQSCGQVLYKGIYVVMYFLHNYRVCVYKYFNFGVKTLILHIYNVDPDQTEQSDLGPRCLFLYFIHQ